MSDVKSSSYYDKLYAEMNVTDTDLMSIYEEIKYHGFNRSEVFQELERLIPDTKVAMYVVLTCALNGPQRAALTKIPGTGKTISEMGIPASGMQRKKGISCARVTAATADLAAFLLKRINPPKRLNMDLPSWLQFPSAGSISMPLYYRQLHIEFSKRFSTVISGSFNESIYMQMMNNAYLDEKIRTALFGEMELEKTHAEPMLPPMAPSGTIAMNPPTGQAMSSTPHVVIVPSNSSSSASSSMTPTSVAQKPRNKPV